MPLHFLSCSHVIYKPVNILEKFIKSDVNIKDDIWTFATPFERKDSIKSSTIKQY